MRNSYTILAALTLSFLIAAPVGAQSMPAAAGTAAAGAADAGTADRVDAEALAGFGTAVAVGDGQVFVGEGANRVRPGMVYVYEPGSDGRWGEVARLTAPESRDGDGFGVSLAFAPGVLLVGQVTARSEGTVHVFRLRGDDWRHAGELRPEELPEGGRYGMSLAIGDGVAAVGARGPNADDAAGAGRVYTFDISPEEWEESGHVEAATPAAGDRFGAAVDLDGTRMLVGAPGSGPDAGVAFVFRQDPGTREWEHEAVLEGQGTDRRSSFGSAVALDRGLALVAAPGHEDRRGSVYQFELDAVASEWNATAPLLPFEGGESAMFGTALAAAHGAVYVGAPGAGDGGAIFVVRRSEDGWAGMDRVVYDRVEEGGALGSTLAVAGNVAVAGATREDFGAGSAVILERGTGEWRPVMKVASEVESLPALTGAEVRCEAGRVADTFECGDVDLLSFLPVPELGGDRGVRLNDVWGWVDPADGREYALVGRIDGTSFVDVSDPSNPRYLGDLPMTAGASAASWRDIKVYENHAFIVADGSGQHGIQVFDLTRLRDIGPGTPPVTFDHDALYDRVASVHNIVVDTASGFAFAVGSGGGGETCGGGLHMVDVRDPTSPTFAGCFADPQTGRASTGYTHDAQCVTYQGPDDDYRGREICLGANETALSIADVTDKDSPVAVARAAYPNVGYTHQGWLTPDHRYFYMNDELDELQGLVDRTRTLIWDVEDLDDPVLVGEYLGTTESSDHNLYIRDDFVYQSNYTSGLQILDISDRENPRQVGHFDTVPYGENAPGFGGSWSNYPFFPSGTIIVTSGSEGLFVLRKRGPIS